MIISTLDEKSALLVVDLHERSMRMIFPRPGETGTSREIVDLLKNGHAA